MVITDIPFSPYAKHNRYSILNRPKSAPPDQKEENEEAKEYADFIKKQEKMFANKSATFISTGATFSKRSEPPKERYRLDRTPTVVDIELKNEEDKKNSQKKLKAIEDHMWQHKQDERSLKRAEGDSSKSLRLLRRSIRDYDQSISKKRFEEEKRLSQSLEKYAKLQQQHLHRNEELTKKRIEKALTEEKDNKESNRKVLLTTTKIARQYEIKREELQLKAIETEHLARDFEKKIRMKQEEQLKLKQELADLAISLNMEAQKGMSKKVDIAKSQKKDTQGNIDDENNTKKELDGKIAKSANDVKASDATKRSLSADLYRAKTRNAMRAREEDRRRIDTRNQLDRNRHGQKSLNNGAFESNQELRKKEIDTKIEVTDARRQQLITRTVREKRDKDDAQQAMFQERFKKRFNEQKVRDHEDFLRHYQRKVKKDEDYEHDLFTKVRNAEYSRQKKEQDVRRLTATLAEAKRVNAVKMKQEMIEKQKEERELEQELAKQQAELSRLHNQREESYLTLQTHRASMREEKHVLEEHSKEHDRLVRVHQNSGPVAV